MGKYPNSEIHNMYSDWHWGMRDRDPKYKRLYVSDLDRLWIEYDFHGETIVAVVDIKWEGSGDTMTATEKGISDWLESKGAKHYVVYITKDFKHFRIVNSKGLECIKDDIGYADWLLSLRSGDNDNGFREHEEVTWTEDELPLWSWKKLVENDV